MNFGFSIAIAFFFFSGACTCVDAKTTESAKQESKEFSQDTRAENVPALETPRRSETNTGEVLLGELEKSDEENSKPASNVLDPRTFAGFSSDETRFAYGAYSKGSGAHIFTVVDSSSGRRVTDMSLHDEKMLDLAEDILQEGGYSLLKGEESKILYDDESLRLQEEPGRIRAQLVRGDLVRSLSVPSYMEGVAQRLKNPKAELWGFSPTGNYLAIKLHDDQGPVLGIATTFQVLKFPKRETDAGKGDLKD